MTSTVMGLFTDNASAQVAVSELLSSGFRLDQMHIFSPRVAKPEADKIDARLASELQREAGMDDFFRSLASAFTDYDELTVLSEPDRQGRVVLSVYADTSEEADRAAEVIDRHSQLDINDFYTPAGGAHQSGMADTAMSPLSRRGARHPGKVLVLAEQSGRPTDRSPNP